MKFLAPVLRRLHWINFPTVALLALLERTPALRIVATAGTFALRSNTAFVLRSSLATAASLGAIHTVAGATQLSISPDQTPGMATVGVGKTILITVTGSQVPPGSWTIISGVPPGLSFTAFGNTAPGISTGIINASTIQLGGVPTTPGSFNLTLKAWQGANGTLDSINYNYTLNVAAAENSAPVFTTHPSSHIAPSGGAIVFFAVAAGSPAPTYQWFKNGAPLSGATTSSLTLSALTGADAASYTCVATNSFGSATSTAANLNVTGGAAAPAIVSQPSSVTAPEGASAAFTVFASGVTSYQWHHNGTALPTGTTATLTLTHLSAAQAGNYHVVLTGAGGTTSSATTALLVSTGLTSRLSNVSVRTTLTAGQILTVGFTMQGGAKPLLVRAAGPGLGALGVPGTMANPKLALFNAASVQVDANDDWKGDSSVAAAIAAVSAFPFVSAASLDAALVRPVEGGHTVQVSGPTAGNLIVEGYDVSSGNSPRLTNLSALNHVGRGADVLIAGFTIAGTGTKNVLIRAGGPSLIPLGVAGTLTDPKLEIFNSAQVKISENDTWAAALGELFSRVGAFSFTSASKDAALIANLPPGGYTVQVSGADGGTGAAIVEVYELP